MLMAVYRHYLCSYIAVKRFIVLVALLTGTGCATLQEADAPPVTAAQPECVILLHGLMRTPRSMGKMEDSLAEAGYLVVNDGYPSRSAQIDVLAVAAIPPAIEKCRDQGAGRINFVTHSLGSILVRYYLSTVELAELGRVVMLGPPNHGSELVDSLRKIPGFSLVYGPAGQQLGTDDASVPLQLGAADYEVGIIIGQTAGPLSGLLPGEDDGTVTVASARLDGMTDFLVLDSGHTFVMNNNEVIRQTLLFLDDGRFDKGDDH
jgi:triacylglycerol lipase